MKDQLYWVHWYNNGFCYRSTHSVTKEGVKEARKLAKILGDKIEVEKM